MGGSGEYGTVCGMNLAAADVACRQMGYDFGSVSSSPCGGYGGSSLCGATGTAVAMKGLACTGGELNIQECSYEEADGTCAGHGNDAIVYCEAHGSRRFAERVRRGKIGNVSIWCLGSSV